MSFLLPGIGVGPSGSGGQQRTSASSAPKTENIASFFGALNLGVLSSVFLIITAVAGFAAGITSELVDPVVARILGDNYDKKTLDVGGIKFRYGVIISGAFQLLLLLMIAYFIARVSSRRGTASVTSAVTNLAGI
jgi:large-conductance mechanosensitive channel